jgi:hypothetical protein
MSSSDFNEEVNTKFEQNEQTNQISLNWKVNIIHSEPENKKNREPFYIQDRRPRSPCRSNSSNTVCFFRKMDKKDAAMDALITNKLKSTMGFDAFISDPTIEELLKK